MFRANPFRPTLKKATASYERGDYYQALSELDAVLARAPQRVPALMLRGEIRQQLKNPSGACADFRSVTYLQSSNALAWRKCGELYYELEKYGEALIAFDTSLKGNSRNVFSLSRRGATKHQLGDLIGAFQDINAALTIERGNSFALEHKAKIEKSIEIQELNKNGERKLTKQDYSGAIQCFNEVLQLDPQNFFALSRGGETKRNLRDYQGALQNLNTAAPLDNENFFTFLWRGKTKFDMQDYVGAIQDFNTVLSVNPDDADAIFLRNKAEKNSQDSAIALLEAGIEAMKKNKYRDAIKKFDMALQLCPKDFGALEQRSEAKRLLGEFFSVLQDLNVLLTREPNRFSILRMRGTVKSRLGDLQGALQDLTAASSLFMGSTDALTLSCLGDVQRQLGKPHEALENLNKAFNAQPHNAFILGRRGETKRILGLLDEALKDFNKALRLKSDDAFSLKNRAETKRQMGDFSSSTVDLRHSASFKERGAFDFNYRAEACLPLKRYGLALEYFDAALAMHPQYICAIIGRGKVRYILKDYPRALEDFDQAFAAGSEDPLVFKWRGQTKAQMGDFSGAQDDIKYAIRLLPNDPEILQAEIEIQQMRPTLKPKDLPQKQSRHEIAWTIRKQEMKVQAVKANVIAYKIGLLKENGENKYLSRDYKGALKDYETALKLAPKNTDLMARRDEIIYQAASEDFDKGLLAPFKHDWILEKRGIVKYNAKDYAGALQDLNARISLSGSKLSFQYRSQVKEQLGDLSGALLDIKNAIRFHSCSIGSDMAYPSLRAIQLRIENAIEKQRDREMQDLYRLASRARTIRNEDGRLVTSSWESSASHRSPSPPAASAYSGVDSSPRPYGGLSALELAKRDTEDAIRKRDKHEYNYSEPEKYKLAMNNVEKGLKDQSYALREMIHNASSKEVKKMYKQQLSWVEKDALEEKQKNEARWRKKNKNKDD